jgi:sugar lactone lactonase YvrE
MRGFEQFHRWIITVVACGSFHALSQEVRFSEPVPFRPYAFKTIGGVSGQLGHTDGIGTNALFGSTTGLAVDTSGNLYIADAQLGGQTIRKMTSDGVVTTLAGKAGDPGEVDGAGGTARFHSPSAVTADHDGNLYVADSFGETIRKVTPAGVVTTLAGLAFTEGDADGTGTDARFKDPTGIAFDNSGNLYVADQLNHTIRRVTLNGNVTTIAGLAMSKGTNDGVGNAARFSSPRALTVGMDGNIYVADLSSGNIRKVTPNGIVSTVATGFGLPTAIASDSFGNLYVVDAYRYRINKVTAEGIISTPVDENNFPVGFKFGGDAGAIAVDKGDNIYVGDAGDNTIQKAASSPNLVSMFLSLSNGSPLPNVTAITEASRDLINWHPIVTNILSTYLGAQLIDANAANVRYQFYRARVH